MAFPVMPLFFSENLDDSGGSEFRKMLTAGRTTKPGHLSGAKKRATNDLRNAPKGWAVFVRGRDGIIETDVGIYI